MKSEILSAFKEKSYRVPALMTLAMVNAVRAGNSINLDAAFRDDKQAQKTLNDALNVLLNIRVWKEVGGKRKAVYTDEAAQFFETNPAARTNHAHRLKRCAKAAAGLIDMKAKVSMDKHAGTLIVSGFGVKQEFGKRTVVLDEKVADGLSERPSYAAIGAIAGRNRGFVPRRGSNTRGVDGLTSRDTSFEGQCTQFIGAMDQVTGPPTQRQLSALKAVRKAIEKHLVRAGS